MVQQCPGRSRQPPCPVAPNHALAPEDGEGSSSKSCRARWMFPIHLQAGGMGCPGRVHGEAPQHLSALRLPVLLVPFTSHQPLCRLPVIPARCYKKDGGGNAAAGEPAVSSVLISSFPTTQPGEGTARACRGCEKLI